MSELTVEEQITAKYLGEPAPEPAPEAAEQVAPETAAETTRDERPRNPDGTFAAAEPAEEPKLLAGKYKDPEALEKAYLELQTLSGRQGNELSEARALREEFTALRDKIEQPAKPTYDPGSIDEYLQSNPQNIPALAQQALDTRDNFLYSRVMDAWGEIDRLGGMDFHARAVAAHEIAELRKELQPALDSVKQVSTASAFEQAFTARAAAHDDFKTVIDSMTEDSLKGFPKTTLDALQTGDQSTKEEVLETLYRWVKAEQAGNIQTAVTQAAAQTAQESIAARTEAAVASASGSQDRQPVSGLDQWRQQFRDSPEFKRHSAAQ